MNRKVLGAFVLLVAFWPVLAHAGKPAFSIPLSSRTMREMDLLFVSVYAVDAGNPSAAIVYDWSIDAGSTGAYFKSVNPGGSADIAFPMGQCGCGRIVGRTDGDGDGDRASRQRGERP